MQAAGLSPPFFESDRSRDLFVVTFLFHHFLGEDDLRWLANFKELRLSDEQARALIFTKETGAINNSAYRDINQVDTLTASISLRNLRDMGLLETRSQGPATYYVPTNKLLAPLAQSCQLESEEYPFTLETHQLSDKTHQLEAKDEKPFALHELPEELQQLLEELNKKSPHSVVRNIILQLCQWKEMTPNQLASLMGREKKHLVRQYLSPLVKEGVLVYKYPQMAGHPRQAYRAANTKEN